MTHLDSPDPMPTSTRATRRSRQKKRSRKLIGGLAVVIMILVGLGFWLITQEGDSPSKNQPPGSTTSSSSTTEVTTSTTVVPRSSDPIVALAQQYDGRYVGTFTNTTFSTTGPASLELRIDPIDGDATFDSDFDGDIFGKGNKSVRRLSGTIKLRDTNAVVEKNTKSFGIVTGRLGNDLSLIFDADNVPDDQVKSFTLTGRLRSDNTGFDATFTVGFRDGTSATGIVTLACDPTGNRTSEVTTVCAMTATR